MTISTWIWLVLFLLGAGLLVFYKKTGGFFRCTLFTVLSGVGTLGLLWLAGRLITIPIAITPLTVAASGILGIPGVLTMLILHLI